MSSNSNTTKRDTKHKGDKTHHVYILYQLESGPYCSKYSCVHVALVKYCKNSEKSL